jgi:hypothetical protein
MLPARSMRGHPDVIDLLLRMAGISCVVTVITFAQSPTLDEARK